MAKAKQPQGVTQRQIQSQRIMREKAAQKKRAERKRKFLIIGITAIVVFFGAGGSWVVMSGFGARVLNNTVNAAYTVTARSGFAIKTLALEGRNRTPLKDVQDALGLKKNMAILQVSLADLRMRLEQISTVQHASVERVLPGKLVIHLVERAPVALWQHEGKIALVDDQGAVMNDIDSTPYKQLPLMVGSDAPLHVKEMLSILAAEPSLKDKFAAAIRIGERRWNMRLKDGKEVKLPETTPEAAWQHLAELDQREKILARDIVSVDMRLPDRVFMKLPPDHTIIAATSGAKET